MHWLTSNLWPFYDADGGGSAPASPENTVDSGDDGGDDDGWDSESASAPIPEGSDADHQSGTVPDRGTSADGQESASEIQPEPVAAAPDDGTGEAAKPKPRRSAAARKTSLQADIDRLVRERAELQRSIEAMQAGGYQPTTPQAQPPGGGSAPPPSAAPVESGQPAGPAMPAPPDYTQFETDEDYQRALQAYHTQANEYMSQALQQMRQEVTSGLDQRLSRRDAHLAEVERQQQLVARMADMRQRHPDFDGLAKSAKEEGVFVEIESNKFLYDLTINSPGGPELLYGLTSDPSVVSALTDLPEPSQQLRNAIVVSPAVDKLMQHFATDAGRADWLQLRHPGAPVADVARAIGALETYLTTASRGPAARAPESISQAAPPAKPPGGQPRSTPRNKGGQGIDDLSLSFDDAMAAQDRLDGYA